MRPDDFDDMTPAQFVYAWIGYNEREQRKEQQAWERERWSTWITTSIQLDPKDRKPITEMFPMPWDKKEGQYTNQLSMEERHRRVDEMKALCQHSD